MSIKIENISLPVCNIFKAVLHKDQLCYQVDLEELKNKDNLKEQLIDGLVLILDNNEDRNMLSSPSSSVDQGYVSIDTISDILLKSFYFKSRPTVQLCQAQSI